MKRLLFYFAVAIGTVLAEEIPALKEYKSGNVLFSANAYKELATQNPGKNLLVCPFSVATILALVENGAKGNTAEQFVKGLNLPDTEDKIKEVFQSFTSLSNTDGQDSLTSANKIYLKTGFTIKPEFRDIAVNVFNAEVKEINFSESEAAAAEINNWVLNKTHDKIKDILSKDDLDDDTRAVLVNTLYFNGLWDVPFRSEATSEKAFKLSSTEEAKVQIMDQTNWHHYYEDPVTKIKFLEMTYKNSQISMVFVLPKDVDGLPALEANIEKVLETPEFSVEKVHVQIPRIKVEQKIDFIPILKKLGVEKAFTTQADFSRITDKEQLYISKIVQKTYIAVEEKGTTAAAATAVLFVVGSSYQPKPIIPKEFEANRPFIFALKCKTAGLLFVGRYLGPNN